MKKTIIASLIGLTFIPSTYALETILVDEVTVKSNRFEHVETETTYASEIHTAKQIENSGAATLLEYLAQQTSLSAPSTNKATASINLRGYGNENGNQNVVITVDGQRLNNIDLTSQLLAGIPLSNIERIEISKGSGSVIYGDGATAGAIQIYTKAKAGVTVTTSLGSYGQKNHSVQAGISEQHIDLSVALAHDSHDGFSKKDETGHKDQFTSNSQNVKLKIKPTDYLRLSAQGTSSRNDTRYVNSLTKAEFKDNPRQVTKRPSSQTYTHQAINSDRWQVGAEYDASEQLTFSVNHFREDKTSEFVNFFNVSSYDYEGNELTANYAGDKSNIIVGVQNFDGKRKSTSNKTTKGSNAFFASAEHQADWLIDGLTLSAGWRKEKVAYQHKPKEGQLLKEKENLNAWDIGANYKVANELSLFTNYNHSFQTPDIDRFFVTDFGTGITTFNDFIKPAKVKTVNLGLNHTLSNNRLKVVVFYSSLKDEIYLDPTIGFFGTNSNLDETHKYGLEIQDRFTFNDSLHASVIYNFTRAKIDKESSAAGAFNGKDLPGVPKHSVVANLNYSFYHNASLNLNHTWRAKAYAYNDFANNFNQKQDSYHITNLAMRYTYKNVDFFAAVNNIFKQENSIQIQDNNIVPIDFVRTWRIGMKAAF
jgi:iron complex outermembrane receptor protein|tara:strand:- start:984 stop:2933 length:1950 start_codon:yes stop_codon:yes gene_type:complete